MGNGSSGGGPGNGKPRGPGTNKPPHVLDVSPEKQRERSARSQEARRERASQDAMLAERARSIAAAKGIGFVAAKMEAWRELQLAENPSYSAPKRPLNKGEIEELFRSYAPDALESALALLNDDRPMAANARARIIELMMDRGYGKPVQPVDVLGGMDGMSDAEIMAQLEVELRTARKRIEPVVGNAGSGLEPEGAGNDGGVAPSPAAGEPGGVV